MTEAKWVTCATLCFGRLATIDPSSVCWACNCHLQSFTPTGFVKKLSEYFSAGFIRKLSTFSVQKKIASKKSIHEISGNELISWKQTNLQILWHFQDHFWHHQIFFNFMEKLRSPNLPGISLRTSFSAKISMLSWWFFRTQKSSKICSPAGLEFVVGDFSQKRFLLKPKGHPREITPLKTWQKGKRLNLHLNLFVLTPVRV